MHLSISPRTVCFTLLPLHFSFNPPAFSQGSAHHILKTSAPTPSIVQLRYQLLFKHVWVSAAMRWKKTRTSNWWQNSSPGDKTWGLLPGTCLYCCHGCTPPPPSGLGTECTRCCAGLCCLWPCWERRKKRKDGWKGRGGRKKMRPLDPLKTNSSLQMHMRNEPEHAL